MKLLCKQIIFFIVPLFLLSGCSPNFKLGNYDDPYENVNRKSHEINKSIDILPDEKKMTILERIKAKVKS